MKSELIENNYLIIPNFINSKKAKELHKEFSEYCENNNISGDGQVENSCSFYNYISFLELLCEKTPEVSSIIEETVLPTYAYSRIYKNGSSLEKHLDRDSCEISLTIHLDGDYPWPIWIEDPNGEKRHISLNPGDAMLYLGKIASHWRDQYPGNYYSQVFLHYVRSRGECSYAYFDNKREESDLKKDHEIINDQQENSNEIKEEKNNISLTYKSTRKIEDYIKVYNNIISEDLCNKILNEYKNSNEWNETFVGDGTVNTNIRNCSDIQISDSNVIDKNYDIRKFLDVDLHQQLLKVVEKYSEEFPNFSPTIDTGYDLLRYETGQFYTQHTDSFIQQQRSVSCSLSLNDDYEGGEFAFFDREIMIRPGVGSVIVFPSNFMYPHEVMPILKGTRYSIITWYV
jgi:hypothetical protein